MSTRFYDAHELGYIAKACSRNVSRSPTLCDTILTETAGILAKYSAKNALAYNNRYRPDISKRAEGWTETDIAYQARNIHTPDVHEALRTFRLMEYNADDLLDGRETEGLLRIATYLIGNLLDARERAER